MACDEEEEARPKIEKGLCGSVEKRSSAVLRCKPHRSTYIHIYASRFGFLRALQLNIFEQPPNMEYFNNLAVTNIQYPEAITGIAI